ncbi:alcohol dehydrogenase catalytic domain-containing protein [Amycolatopsis nigrescens]|uniref:alcohol dehydrogenase catalytic domain-containing protein n=1 Tax=Amycolatopsis nigrescens TaxID=381445 RepID=UPI00036E46FC|nr:alcohol dehydrogenase catalytic domain-containing protein [Amycolatopsis nigrescens]
MKAAVIPEVNGRWELLDVPMPQPGPGEVLIKVAACGMCVNDVMATRGQIPFPAITPAITGHEPVGEVVELGRGVTSRAVGDRVGATWVRATCGRCDYCRLGLPVTGQSVFNCVAPVTTGFSVQGGHAEYLVAGADETVLIPDGLSAELAAPVLCAGYTSWSALCQAEPGPGERVAVLGVGGLGHLALQFSHTCGYETVAMTNSAEKHELAGKLGADFVVGSGAELREAGGADVILVTAPSYSAATEAMQGLRVGGRLVLAGIDPDESFVIPPAVVYPFFAQGNRILGATHNGLPYLREALRLVAEGRVTPMVEVFEMAEVADAVDRVGKGDVRFRAVVKY